jgi:NADPH:quinone reductase-like Zn-dependent oxidoreductase
MTAGLPTTMRALLMTRTGGPEVLEIAEVATPVVKSGEVLVRVAAVTLSRQDTYTLAGRGNIRDLRLPHVLGNDPAGVVVALGDGVDEVAVGDRVAVKPSISCEACESCLAAEDDACASLESIGLHRWGGFAEYVAVPAKNVTRIPDGLSFVEAAALAHTAPVALNMLRNHARLRAGETVLVTSASGAIGAAAVQVAKHDGARVIAAAGGADRVAFARELGPDLVIDYRETPAFAPLVAAAAPDGVAVYVESAGDPAIWSEALKTLGRRARVVACGSHGGPVVELNLNWLFRMRVRILGSSGSTRATFREAFELAGSGAIRPNIDVVIPLAEARSGFGRLARRGAGANRGKIILQVAEL